MKVERYLSNSETNWSLITFSKILEKVFSILTGLKLEISFLFGLPLSSGITEAILASSGNTPYFRLLFTAIEREVLSISAESFTNLGGILSKPIAF